MQKCIISAKVVIKIDSPICLKYVVEHIKPQDIEQPEDNGYKNEFVPFINLAATYGSIMSVFGIVTYYSDKGIKSCSKSNLNKKDNKKIA